MNNKNELELLAPAGSLQTLKSVIGAGADAVYLGGELFGARAYAKNFSKEELCDGIDYVHLHGKKIFLTVNTLLKNREIENELVEYLTPYYERGLDAVIVQDFGVLNLILEKFPEMHVHASTQMTIAGADGAEFLKSLGVKRVVTARELSLKEIKNIKERTGMEIESFVHGALCYSYSGQCLMSSMLGGRSGNRGRCAGTCRLPYHVGKEQDVYALSLKDLCTIDMIPDLAESGIYSFKIEGRMKSSEYAAGVTEVYRRNIDRYLENGRDGFYVSGEDHQKLLDFGNRSGFTKGYYEVHNDREMVTYEKPNHTKGNESLLEDVKNRFILPAPKIPVHGSIELFCEKPMHLKLFCGQYAVEVDGEVVQKALKRPMLKENIEEKIKKTGDTEFVFDELNVIMDDQIFIPVQNLNEIRREACAALKKEILHQFKREHIENGAVSQLAEKSHKVKNLRKQIGECSVLVAKEEQLLPAIEKSFCSRIYLDHGLYIHTDMLTKLKCDSERIHESGKQCFFALPTIFRMETADYYDSIWKEIENMSLDGFLARSYDELGFLREHGVKTDMIILDFNLYTFSNQTESAFGKVGFPNNTAPVELNQKELMHRNNSTSEMIIYGYLPLMITANCINKNFNKCDKKQHRHMITDRYQKNFSVLNYCNECYNVILNSDCQNLFGQKEELTNLGMESVRISLSVEDKQETEQILENFEAVFLDGNEKLVWQGKTDFTNGHFKRGVE